MPDHPTKGLGGEMVEAWPLLPGRHYRPDGFDAFKPIGQANALTGRKRNALTDAALTEGE